MAEPATLYVPFPYPGPPLLEAFVPEGVSVTPEGDVVMLRWPGGSIQVHPMPREEVPAHLKGMVGYLEQNGAAPSARVRAMHSQCVLGMMVEPAVQDEAAWPILLRLLGLTDGLLFLGGNFYTRDGETLLGDGLPTPTAEQVARRSLVLLALASRGLIDQDAGTPNEAEANEVRTGIWEWMVGLGLHEDAEESEATLLQTPIGRAEPQDIVNAVWRAEGAQVLLWALGARDLPPHDAQEHPYEVGRDAGLRGEGMPPVLASPRLRSAEEIEAQRLRLQGITWRFVEQRVNPGVVDFADYATRAPFGAFSVEGLPLIDGDLALQGAAISHAPPEVRSLCSSMARERYLAANWLVGVNPVYSSVDTPT